MIVYLLDNGRPIYTFTVSRRRDDVVNTTKHGACNRFWQ
jgi:hypothetical protein